MKYIISFCLVLNFLILISGYIVDPGPVVKASKGAVWPKPKYQIVNEQFSIIRPSVFNFEVTGHTCDIIEEARSRYMNIMRNQLRRKRKGLDTRGMENRSVQQSPRRLENWRKIPYFDSYLEVVNVNLLKPCETKPYLNMDESYTFKLENSVASIEAPSVWGILRGFETFSQLLYFGDDGHSLVINSTEIQDSPRFSHRGLLLDTSRHFMPIYTIYQILDGMSYNKLNVFHWHIVDDHSFPYQSIVFPELSEKGAYDSKTMIYSQDDIKNINEFARKRGIRVIAEFDTPGHTRSWGISHPEILTECSGPYEGKLGPIDPTVQETYNFLEQLYTEVVQVFPDEFVHLGGDEVGFECWESNTNIKDYMKENNLTTFQDLEEQYIQRIVDLIKNLKAKSIVWQEVFENGVRLPIETVVHIWTGDQKYLLNRVTQNGLKALLSSCWYLDHLSTGGDWKKFYTCDPHDFNGSTKQKELVMGGEACMWSEVVDMTNVISRIFPRVSATAEKLWSQYEVNDFEDAKKRIEEQTCRMRYRGISAQPPNGPGFC